MRNHLTSKKRLGAAIGVSVAAVMIAGGAAISIAADDSNDGRDPGARPGAPVDPASAPAPAETDDGGGRDNGDRPGAAADPASAPARVVEAAVDNGRGGVDPAPPIQDALASEQVVAGGDVGANDSDTGVAPESDRGAVVVQSDEARSVPTDQDVPGAPTGSSEPVAALPGETGNNDQDG